MSSKISDFSSAYKLTRRTETNTIRLKRQLTDWKNTRHEEVGKRRNLHKISPMNDSDQNISNSRRRCNYDGKTPSKKGSKDISRREMLLKWREDRKQVKQEESKKNKPSFKVHHVKHIDTELYNRLASGTSTRNRKVNASCSEQAKPVLTTRSKGVTQATVTRSTRASSVKQPATTNNKLHPAVPTASKNAARPSKKPPSPPVTRRVTRQMATVVEKKEKKASAKTKMEKVKKPAEKTQVSKKKSYTVDLKKVRTKRGEISDDNTKSFAPSDYMFTAPNVTSFTFKPLSPASAADFLCQNNETASTFAFTADPSVGRCSTPLAKKSKKSNKKDQKGLVSGGAASSDDDVTTYSVLVDGKKVTRSTRKSSLGQANTDGSSDQSTRNIHDRNTVAPDEDEANSDTKPTDYTVMVDGTPVKRGRKSLKSAATEQSLSRESDNDEAYKITPKHSHRKSANLQNSGPTHRHSVFTPRRSTRKSLRAASSDSDSVVENAVSNDSEVPCTSDSSSTEFTTVKTPKSSKRKSLRRKDSGNALSEKNGNNISKDEQSAANDGESNDTTTSSDSEKERSLTRLSIKSKRSKIMDKTSPEKSVELPRISEGLACSDEEKSGHSASSSLEMGNNQTSSDSDKDVKNPKSRSSRKKRKSQIAVSKNDAEKSVVSEGEVCSNAEMLAQSDKRESTHLFEVGNESVSDSKNKDGEKAAMEIESSNEAKQLDSSEKQSSSRKSKPVCPIMYQNIEQNGNGNDTKVSEESAVTSKSEKKVFSGTPVKRSRRKSSSSVEQFRQPGEPMSTRKSARKRRKTTACDIPPELRSPEEWVEILASSPMVEMSRRTPKLKTPPGKVITVEPLNFDDLDDEIPQIINPFSEIAVTTEKCESMDIDLKAAGSSEDIIAEASGEHDIKYFRDLLVTESARLQNYCTRWEAMDHSNSTITEESEGQIRTVIGQAQLLMGQRFKQFRGLVDDCEFKRGEKETTCTDLQGFWDMIFFQVEDVDKKFDELQKLKDKNWVVEKTVEKKKIIKKKPLAAKAVKPVVSKFARFRAEMKKNQAESNKDSEEFAETFKVFDAGFFKVQSPVKSSARHCTETHEGPSKDTAIDLINSTNIGKKDENGNPSVCKVLQVNKTPNRRSYAPSVPSPLLRDITPKHGIRKMMVLAEVSVPRKLIESEAGEKENTPALEPETTPATDLIFTPRRRSLRLRNVSADDSASAGTDILSDEFKTFLEPVTVASPVYSGKRRSSLKVPLSSAKRRSRPRSVKFSNASPIAEGAHVSLPSTPFNRDSLVAKARVSKSDVLIDLPDVISDFDITEEQSYVTSKLSRPSLLFTPDKDDKVTVHSAKENLINFSPL